MVFYFLHPFRGSKRNGTHATHTACVQASVVLADAFIVFRFGQNAVVFTVGEHENGTFRSAEKLFYYD